MHRMSWKHRGCLVSSTQVGVAKEGTLEKVILNLILKNDQEQEKSRREGCFVCLFFMEAACIKTQILHVCCTKKMTSLLSNWRTLEVVLHVTLSLDFILEERLSPWDMGRFKMGTRVTVINNGSRRHFSIIIICEINLKSRWTPSQVNQDKNREDKSINIRIEIGDVQWIWLLRWNKYIFENSLKKNRY